MFSKPDRFVDRVFLHCSASDDPRHDLVSVVRDWHVSGNGWSDVGYHFFIRKSGLIEPGRDLERPPAAQAGNNTGTIAICLHGLKENAFSEAQFVSLRALCRQIDKAYGQAVTFHGHCEVSAKSCPVFDYRKILNLDHLGRLGPLPGSDQSAGTQAPRSWLDALRAFLRTPRRRRG